VTGDPEELAARQRVMESDQGSALGLLQIDLARQGQGIGAAACRALEDGVRARWPWARRLRLSVVRSNDPVLGFWHRMGFTETGEVRPCATTSSSPR